MKPILKKHLITQLALLLLAPLTALAAAETRPAQPNLVVILVDDMGYGDIGPFGSKLNRTPNLDRMAAEGMRLTSFYGAPVCTPSRAQMMTGCYAKRVSLPRPLYPSSPIGISPREHTVAELLKQQGYATMAIGKWHLGDQPEFLPTQHGFEQYYGLPYSNDMGGNGKTNANGKIIPLLPLVRDTHVIEAPVNQDTLTERYTAEAVKFITAHQARPFFLYFPHTAVHTPLHPGPNFKGKSANGRYGDWVEEVDWSVGRVLDTLKALQLDAKTLVLFTSDNGPWLSQGTNGGTAGPLRGGKSSTWEGGVREPTIVRWPGRIAAGSASDAIVSELDVLPTFVRLAGGSVPTDHPIDGQDVWPLLAGQTQESPREAFFYFNENNRIEAVRAGPWKLAIAPQALPKAQGMVNHTGPRLYNLATDLGEMTDVAAQHPDVVARLQQQVQQMDADLGEKSAGPGVRAPGQVADPKPLLKRIGIEYD